MTNPYERAAQKNIPAVLVYLFSGDAVLLIHRSDRPGDFHSGKWNGLGGKLELLESPFQAALREVREESGIQLNIDQLCPKGWLTFPDFKSIQNEDWCVFLFTATLSPEQAQSFTPQSDEGSLHWIPKSEVLSLPTWPGDRLFLPQILRNETVFGTIWYEAGHPKASEGLVARSATT